MELSKQTAKHFREVFFGGNWSSVNLKESLADVTWKQATEIVYPFNSIAMLVFHINYYVSAVLKVLHGEPLNASDKYSFDLPPIFGEDDWKTLVNKMFADAEDFAKTIEQMPEGKLWDDFSEDRYGNFYRNIQGIIEHTHYHLGQIVLIKKLVSKEQKM